MNTQEIIITIDKIEKKLANLKVMIQDYEGCKSPLSKKVIEDTIIKVIKPFEDMVKPVEKSETIQK